MKVFVLVSDIPFAVPDRPGVTAVNIILHQILDELARLGARLVLQPIFHGYRKAAALTSDEESQLAELRSRGLSMHARMPRARSPP